jgi:hypothetical protein
MPQGVLSVQTLDRRPGRADSRDDGTNDLLVGNMLRTNELQVWFLAEHLVDTPTVRA